MALAAAGGGLVTLLARREVAQRRGHPDTVSPAQAEAARPASAEPPPASTPARE